MYIQLQKLLFCLPNVYKSNYSENLQISNLHFHAEDVFEHWNVI